MKSVIEILNNISRGEIAMPSDSQYDRMYEAEDKARAERKRKLIIELYSMTLEEKVDFLLKNYINNVKY